MIFALIAAVDARNGIGKGGTLPWKLGSDLAFFHSKTVGAGHNAVIMGRTTWESIPQKFRPLPQRLNIVLSHDDTFVAPEGASRAESFPEALSIAEDANIDELYVIGGAKVFAFSIHNPACKRIFLTLLHQDFHCDAFFPEIPVRFKKVGHSKMQHENGIDFEFIEYAA